MPEIPNRKTKKKKNEIFCSALRMPNIANPNLWQLSALLRNTVRSPLSFPLPKSRRVPPWAFSLGNCNDVGSSLGPQGRWGSFFWRVGGSFSIDTTCQSAYVIIIPLTIPFPCTTSLQASLISQTYLSFFCSSVYNQSTVEFSQSIWSRKCNSSPSRTRSLERKSR